MSPRSAKAQKRPRQKKNKNPSLSELYSQTKKAKTSWTNLRNEFYRELTEETVQELDEEQAHDVFCESVREDNQYSEHRIIRSVVKAFPKAIPNCVSSHRLPEAKRTFWKVLSICVEYGDRERALSLINFEDWSIPSGAKVNWEGFDEFVNQVFTHLEVDDVLFNETLLRQAKYETVLKYLDKREGKSTTDRMVAAVRERLLAEDHDFVAKNHSRLIKRFPAVNTAEFWDKWFAVSWRRLEYGVEVAQAVGGAAVEVLHRVLLDNDKVSSRAIREYLKAFPNVDKEPFVKKLKDAWTMDPEKMARDYLTGNGGGRDFGCDYGPHPMILMHMMGGYR
jgi:hypothetical protein